MVVVVVTYEGDRAAISLYEGTLEEAGAWWSNRASNSNFELFDLGEQQINPAAMNALTGVSRIGRVRYEFERIFQKMFDAGREFEKKRGAGSAPAADPALNTHDV